MPIKKHDLDNWIPADPTNPLKSLAIEVNANFDSVQADLDTINATLKKITTATTTATTSSPPVVGGAVNPMYSPIATTTAMKGYIAAYCNAGVFLTLDNIKVSVTTGGSRGLCMATVSGTMTCSISGHYMYSYASAEGTATTYPGANYTTTPSGSFFNWSFGNAGDTSVFHINDYTNLRFYRVTVMIGASYNSNAISIERLI